MLGALNKNIRVCNLRVAQTLSDNLITMNEQMKE